MKERTQILFALRSKRAEIASHIQNLDRKASRWRTRLASIDDTIRLFSPETDPEEIKPKRPFYRSRYFGRGEFARLCLDALRKADKPLTTAEIVASVIAAKGLPDSVVPNLKDKALTYLRTKLTTNSVIKTGTTQGTRWALVQDS
jgi:hypothetical protein